MTEVSQYLRLLRRDIVEVRSLSSGDASMGATDLELRPKDGTAPVRMRARPFPAYDSPSARVVLRLPAEDSAKRG